MAKGKIMGEFKTFIARGNVIDMAVGIIIGTAFTAIVQSMVNEILMPLISLVIGGVNLASLKWVITPALHEIPAVTLNYGNFIQKCIDFFLIALVIFFMVRGINSFHAKRAAEAQATAAATPPAPPAPDPQVELLTEIRDLLQKNNK